ncbi:hypothetical protein [Brevundimonas sp. M20]|uniref:hypothetical protein n=1 Tax=Brevundimonas sp. M20 TaxID=2591463 RepID=UPI00114643FF|nr:hypothetical protein [Brevundimonas sp. M20]QDH72321.1 hypothetical protein FKQ52_02095 [Brevundimonas sp. M20]
MARLNALLTGLWARARACGSVIRHQWAHILDMEQFHSATSWRDRLKAVAWKRVAIIGSGLATVALAVSLGAWLLQPEFRGRPPRLPTEQEWRANQDAGRAMEAELSPALAEANKAVPN